MPIHPVAHRSVHCLLIAGGYRKSRDKPLLLRKLPLSEAELHTIATNVAPYLR